MPGKLNGNIRYLWFFSFRTLKGRGKGLLRTETQKRKAFQSIIVLLLSLIAFSLPYNFRITTFLLIFFGIVSIFHFYIYPRKIPRIAIYFAIPSVAYYLLYCISFFYSVDKSTSFSDLETKFSLLALPILILCMCRIRRRELRLIFYSFIAGLILFEMSSLIAAFYTYVKTGQIQQFYYHHLVEISDINAVYFSWYVIFSLIILLLFDISLPKRYSVPLVGFQIIYLFLLSSRAMQLSLILLLIPYALFRFFKKYPQNKIAFISFSSIYLSILLIAIWSPSYLNSRWSNLKLQSAEQAFLPSYNHHSYDFDNINTRLFFWRVGIDNIKNINLLIGAGNGDVNRLQNQRMHELGILNIFNKKNPSDFFNMNLHNMYLQSIIAIGILGLLLFLYMSILPISLALKRANPVLLLFHLVAALFMLHESALQTQSGVVFYSFFSMLLINQTIHQSFKKNA